MKKFRYIWMIFCLALLLPACTAGQPEGTEETSQVPVWQEQYDLGVRYLFDGDYEGAILAFSAAIEIDPKRAPAYVGRGDAYVKSGETESNLAAALADYEKAIELDEINAEAYLGLADVYIRQGDYEMAINILNQGMEKCPTETIKQKLASILDDISNPSHTECLVLDASYFKKDLIQNAQITIGGQNVIDLSFEDIVDYYGASNGETTYRMLSAQTEQGPDGPNPHIDIQWHTDTSQMYVNYSSRHGVGTTSELNQPEFLEIVIDDKLEDILSKLGLNDNIYNLLQNHDIQHFNIQILAGKNSGTFFPAKKSDFTQIDIFRDQQGNIIEAISLHIDNNGVLERMTIQWQSNSKFQS